jgi:hypothetical protein
MSLTMKEDFIKTIPYQTDPHPQSKNMLYNIFSAIQTNELKTILVARKNYPCQG